MTDQKLRSNFPTLERLALNRIREQFPGMKRKGFSGAVRAACASEGLPQVPIIPDAWMVDGDYLTGEDRGKPATFTLLRN